MELQKEWANEDHLVTRTASEFWKELGMADVRKRIEVEVGDCLSKDEAVPGNMGAELEVGRIER